MKMTKVVVMCFTLAFIASFLGSGLVGAKIQGDTGECDLRCWVNKLVVVIPEVIQTFTFIVDGTFTLKNLTISNIELGAITTNWYPDENANTSTAVKLTITDVGVDVWSLFRVKWGVIDVNGQMVANVTKSTFGLAIQLDKGSDGLVDYVDCPYCDLALTIEDAYIKTSSGALNTIANVIIDLFKGVIEDQLQNLACDMLPDMIRSNVTALFQMVNGYIRPYLNTTFPRVIPVTGEMVDLRGSPVIDVARFILNVFTGTDGPLNFNHVINILSSNTGQIRLSDWYNETIAFEIPISTLNATITIGLLDLNLTQLNTWDYFEVLVPIGPYLLNSHTGLEELGINVTFFVNVTVNGTEIRNSEFLYESANLVIHVSNNELWAQMQLASYSGLAATYTNAMCTNLSCIVSLINGDSTALTHLIFNTTISLIEMLAAGGSLEADVQQTLDKIIKLFLDNYKFAIPPLLNGLVGGPGTDFINSALSDLIKNTSSSCEHLDDPSGGEVETGATTGAALGFSALYALIAIVPFIFFVRECRKKKAHSSKAVSATGNPEIATSPSTPRPEAALESGAEYAWTCSCATGKLRWMKEFGRTDPAGASLFMDRRVNVVARFLIPLLVLLDIAFFVSSNTGVGASVFVLITLGEGRLVELPSLFSFGLLNTIEDMWTAGVYPLAILIAVMSGIWPYLKLVLMFIAWLMPTSIFKEKWRENNLMMLDMLGKWSLIDSYVMVLMLVAFHFHVVFPIVNNDYIDTPVLIDVFVKAAYGFVSFMLATLISLVLSHVILFFHRNVKARKDENSGPEATKFKALLTYCNPKRLVIPIRIGILLLLIIALVLVVIGVSIVSFSFDFLGLAGWALGLLGLDSHREYGVVTLGVAVPSASRTPNSFGIRITQIVYLITAFIFPILHLAVLIFLWVVPLTRKIQKHIYVACEILNAWSCLEVFIISIIAAILEISQFAAFMVGDKCDFLTPYIVKFFNETLDGHTSCFEVRANLQTGCWCLFIACIIYIIAAMIIMRVCRAALDKRSPPNSSEENEENTNNGNQLDDMKTRRINTPNSYSNSTTPALEDESPPPPPSATMVIHPPPMPIYPPYNQELQQEQQPTPYFEPPMQQMDIGIQQQQEETITEESEIVPSPMSQRTLTNNNRQSRPPIPIRQQSRGPIAPIVVEFGNAPDEPAPSM